MPLMLARFAGRVYGDGRLLFVCSTTRSIAAADRSIQPEAFRLPDLTSPRAHRVAERKGIDLDRWLATH